MNLIVTDKGFQADDWSFGFQPAETLEQLLETSSGALALDVVAEFDVSQLTPLLDQIDLIRIDFAGFADGRGFSQARQLRMAGYQGRLRAAGNVISDQYHMARRAGFDEVEIDAQRAERQPQSHWLERINAPQASYQLRLRQFD